MRRFRSCCIFNVLSCKFLRKAIFSNKSALLRACLSKFQLVFFFFLAFTLIVQIYPQGQTNLGRLHQPVPLRFLLPAMAKLTALVLCYPLSATPVSCKHLGTLLSAIDLDTPAANGAVPVCSFFVWFFSSVSYEPLHLGRR